MKKLISNILNGVVTLTAFTGIWSCASENPFESEGEGIVRLTTVVNSITTRADESTSDPLRENCVVYISNEKGLVYKEKGLDNVKESFSLKAGEYVAEAWSGDSVTASFDKMFFRGYEPFSVTKGSNTNVVLNCKIQNVVVSINASSIDPKVLKDDYQITIKNSRGKLVFDKTTASSERGYFMMPDGDDTLEYEITGTSGDGESFTKTGVVKKGVERAHHYILNFKYGGNDYYGDGNGAVFFQITIADENLDTTTSVLVPAAPSVIGEGFNIEKQQNFTNDANIPESGLMVKVCAFGNGINELTVASSSASQLGIPSGTINVYNLNSDVERKCRDAGLSWTEPTYKESTNVSTAYLSFSKEMLIHLSAQNTQHIITIGAKDKNGYSSSTELRIARSADAIIVEDPIVVEPVDTEADKMSLTGSSFTVSYSLSDEYDGTPGVEYRKAGSEEWTFKAASGPSKISPKNIQYAQAEKYRITITGLEPGTTYQYRACCGEFHGDILSVTTESTFSIPNASFEDWSSYQAKTLLGTKTVVLPGSTGDKETSFWGSGNEGAATANMTLTNKSEDMKHSGQYSAKLASNSAMGVIAAGNIFTGKYVETDGTNGVLSVGRPYNGSHPSKVRVYANYRPGSGVSVKDGNEKYLPANFNGGKDHGQIYVALTTEAVEIRTNPDKRKLFDQNDPVVLAYGQVTWTDNFGPDGQLQEVDIPLEYNERANKAKPTHLVIVCSASKYGDYFSGSASSVMYVDDFELIYE